MSTPMSRGRNGAYLQGQALRRRWESRLPGPADQELAANSPPSPQTETSRIQDAASASSPEINERPPSDEDYLSSGESYPSDHGYTSSENYHASDEGGPRVEQELFRLVLEL
jgi:hypothetical protein